MRYTHQLHRDKVTRPRFRWLSAGIFFFIIAIIAAMVGFSGLFDIDKTAFLAGIFSSLFRVSVAYIIAFILAVTIGLLVSANSKVEELFLPILDVLQSFPSFVLFPILVAALRSQPDVVIILVLTITIIWPILFAIISGIKARREDLEEAATIFGAVKSKRFFNFTLPMLLPSIVTGSIVGWGEGWEFIIGAELLVSTKFGIGKYLGQLGTSGQNSSLFFGVLLLLVFLFLINKILWLPLLHSSTKFQADA